MSPSRGTQLGPRLLAASRSQATRGTWGSLRGSLRVYLLGWGRIDPQLLSFQAFYTHGDMCYSPDGPCCSCPRALEKNVYSAVVGWCVLATADFHGWQHC